MACNFFARFLAAFVWAFISTFQSASSCDNDFVERRVLVGLDFDARCLDARYDQVDARHDLGDIGRSGEGKKSAVMQCKVSWAAAVVQRRRLVSAGGWCHAAMYRKGADMGVVCLSLALHAENVHREGLDVRRITRCGSGRRAMVSPMS